MKKNKIVILAFGLLVFSSCKKDSTSAPAAIQPTVTKATGDIKSKVDAFRAMLGPINTTPNATGGHRELNWDALPASLENKVLPNDIFNPIGTNASPAMQRGLAYGAEGSFMISSDGFAQVNSAAAGQFAAFSGNKTFANTSASQWDMSFQQAGSAKPASVQAFGLVFSDVDKDNSTSLEFFEGDKSVGKFFLPAHDANSSFSFLGVQFNNNEHVTKIKVNHDGFLAEGTKDISDGGTRDLVVLDDFIYSEPVAQ
ncbi:MAG: hypothetical protein ABIN89_04605 [Chitinophagaceae bacterium]